jgi:hypothetical protein
MAGPNSGASTNWMTIGAITNDFSDVQNIEGDHYGLITWYPPSTSNVDYLLRIYGVASSGPTNYYSADLAATNITANGDGHTWRDWAVLGIRVLPIPVAL